MAEYNCINCKYGNTTDDYEHCGNCDNGSEFVKMTNADRIRAMSDEELAEFIENKKPCEVCSCGKDGICYCGYGETCHNGILKWLKSEAKE